MIVRADGGDIDNLDTDKVQSLANGEAVPHVVPVGCIFLPSASIDTRWLRRMLACRLNGFDEVILVTFDAYDVGDFRRLDVAAIVFEQLIA